MEIGRNDGQVGGVDDVLVQDDSLPANVSGVEMRRRIRGQVAAPLFALGDALEELEAALEEAPDVRHHDEAADEPAGPAEGHGEAEFVGERDAAVAGVEEGVVVLEGGEAAGGHAVLKEGVGHEVRDEAFVEVREAELPALPAHGVPGVDEAGHLASDGMHFEFLLDDGDAGGEAEAAVERSVDGDAIPNGKHGIEMPYDTDGRASRVVRACHHKAMA